MNPEFLRKIITKGTVCEDRPMSEYTTFGVGGPAKVFVNPGDEEELGMLLRFLSGAGEEYFILGNGSNLLVSDKGYPGVVINLGRNPSGAFSGIKIENTGEKTCLSAGAGAKLAAVGAFAEEHSLTGFECLTGIPGSIGGAAVMNAGAYGGEFKDVFAGGRALDSSGTAVELRPEMMDFGYRHSVVSERGLIVTSTKIRLKTGSREEITAKIRELAAKRREKQPLEYPSAGSTFKRPEGYFAGKLIEDAGLRGYRIGGASVSEKHCGFVINDRGAKASEIYELIQKIRETVRRETGVDLETEIKFLGEFE